jgi:hypothetical protein
VKGRDRASRLLCRREEDGSSRAVSIAAKLRYKRAGADDIDAKYGGGADADYHIILTRALLDL